MTMPRLGLALMAGCCCLYGCATPPGDEPVVTDAQKPAPEVVEETMNLCEGRPIEVLEEFWDAGGPKTREEAVLGDDGEFVLHGKTTQWWENGQKKMEMSFDCGVRHGTKRTWWPDGQAWSTGQTIHGKDHGTWTVWHQNGNKAKEFNLDHGVWDGPYTVWHPNAQKKLEFMFVRGLQQGRLTIWDEQGNVVREVDYVDGEEQPMPGP